MVRESKALFRVNIATKEAFPDNATSTSTAVNIYRGVALTAGTKGDLSRVSSDTLFREDVTKVVSVLPPSVPSQHSSPLLQVREGESGLRSEVRKLALIVVPEYYKFADLTEAEVIILVHLLLEKHKYKYNAPSEVSASELVALSRPRR